MWRRWWEDEEKGKRRELARKGGEDEGAPERLENVEGVWERSVRMQPEKRTNSKKVRKMFEGQRVGF